MHTDICSKSGLNSLNRCLLLSKSVYLRLQQLSFFSTAVISQAQLLHSNALCTCSALAPCSNSCCSSAYRHWVEFLWQALYVKTSSDRHAPNPWIVIWVSLLLHITPHRYHRIHISLPSPMVALFEGWVKLDEVSGSERRAILQDKRLTRLSSKLSAERKTLLFADETVEAISFAACKSNRCLTVSPCPFVLASKCKWERV